LPAKTSDKAGISEDLLFLQETTRPFGLFEKVNVHDNIESVNLYEQERNFMGDTLKDLKERRSIRKYKAEQIKDSELDAVLEAGVWAASGNGAQSAVMVVLQDPAKIARLEKLNAKVLGNEGAKPFYGAPTVVTVLADKERVTWVDDGNMVIANLLNAAHAVGLGSCYIYRAGPIFESAEGKALLKEWGLGENYGGIGHVLLGYADDSPRPAPRKSGRIIKIR
jgi:nitroreductase